MIQVECRVNLDGLEDKLKELGPKLARKALRKAVKSAGELWVSEMKSRVPVDTGNLRESIGLKVQTGAEAGHGFAKVSVGPMFDTADLVKGEDKGDSSQNPGIYGMFVEFGTKNAHPEPFMRPTFDATADQVVEKFVSALRDDLESIVKS